MTHYLDLRAYLEALDALGDVRHVTREVSADLEAAAIIRLSTERGGPLPLFENVAGVAPGFRLFGAPAALSSVPGKPFARLALSLGLPAESTGAELVDHLARTRDVPPVPPKLVSREEAPCKQNILLGDEATLDRFPVPRVHQDDGGNYPNTWGVIVAKTPDGQWVNWSISRVMQIDGTHLTGQVHRSQHIGRIWEQWAKLGRPMPFALVQGGDPAISVIGGIPIPGGVDEAGFIGALHGEPVPVVRCETSDLEVPATAEIVIEGYMSPSRDVLEGPFAEFNGYANAEQTRQPLFTIEAITYRDDPIWPIIAVGRPADDAHVVMGTGESSQLLAELREAGLPVTTVWLPLPLAAHWSVITVPGNWRETLPGISPAEFAHRIADVVDASRAGRFASHVFVLDDDIDPTNDSDVLWALASRIHPVDRKEVRMGPIHAIELCYTDEERHAVHGPVVISHALQAAPGEGRMPHASFAQAYPPEIQTKALQTWGD